MTEYTKLAFGFDLKHIVDEDIPDKTIYLIDSKTYEKILKSMPNKLPSFEELKSCTIKDLE